jgi:hypothetical protein
MMYRSAVTLSLLAVLINSGCSTPHRLELEDLKHSAYELSSLAAECELFLTFVAGGHATRQYAATHPEYLKKQSTDALETLSESVAGSDVQPLQLEELQKLAQRLQSLVADLTASNRSSQLQKEFASVHQAIRHAGLDR